MTRNAISFDLDSTLADTRQRQWMVPMIRGEAPNPEGYTWTDYSMLCEHDETIDGVCTLLRGLYFGGYYILINTGRSAAAEDLTRGWLNRHFVPYNHLAMRPVGDHRPNAEHKIESIIHFEVNHSAKVILHVDDWAEAAEEVGRQLKIPTVVIPGPFVKPEPAAWDQEKG
jgi:hypothetical protein